jgi:RNA polymerase sigma-70 factor (ECF subfamily)
MMAARLHLAQPLRFARPAGPAAEAAATASDEDAALVESFRRGERAAFEALCRRHQRPLYFFVLRQVRDRDEAADLAQRTLVRAFQKLDGLRSGTSFRAWLYRIAVNLTLNHVRDHARFVHDALDDAPAPHTSPTDDIARAQESRRLRAAVERLPPKQRLTLELRVYEDLSFREVAEALGSNEGAAKVNFHHAVKRLKQLLGEPEGDEP